MYCRYCGAEIKESSANFCEKCGAAVENQNINTYNNQVIQPNVQRQVYVQPTSPILRANGLGVAGFVVSIVSCAIILLSYSGNTTSGVMLDIIAFLLSLGGLFLGIFGKRRKGLAIAGLIMSVAAFILFLILHNSINSGIRL